MISLTEDKVLDSCLSEILPTDVQGGEFLNSLRQKLTSQLSSSHKIPKPLLYHILKKTYLIENLPEGLQSDLKKVYLLNFTRNTTLLEEFIKIQTLFATEDIEIMPLKGMALLFSVYKDIGLRPMDDIDLLVKRKDYKRARELLIVSGYQDHELPFYYTKMIGRRTVLLDMQHELWYLKTMSGFKSSIYGIERIWENVQRIYLEDGKSAKIMEAEDLLIHVVAHAAIDHVKPRLLWLYDIISICESHKEKMRWDVFLNKVVNYNLGIAFYRLFKLVKENFNGAIPEFVIDELKPKKNNFFEARLYGWFLNNSSITWLGHILRIFSCSSLSGKIRLVLFYLFPGRELMAERYKIKNKRLVYFYYPLRAAIFLGRLIKMFFMFTGKKYNIRA